VKRVVQKFGGSLVVTIPANVARRLDIREGDNVDVDEQEGGIVIRPARTLAELVAGWSELAPQLSDADIARGIRLERDARSESL
jgi:AbrB family looped-hinge helix DNA binding protein